MWVRLTFTKVDPAKLDEARAFYNSEAISGVIREQQGYRFHYLLESVANPGEAISVSAWDSEADGEAYEKSGTYAELVGKFRQWFTAPPELKSYEVRE